MTQSELDNHTASYILECALRFHPAKSEGFKTPIGVVARGLKLKSPQTFAAGIPLNAKILHQTLVQDFTKATKVGLFSRIGLL